MQTLILYSSVDGHTKKIAETLRDHINEKVDLFSLDDQVTEQLNLEQYDQIIIGASIRYGHFRKNVYQFIEKNKEILNKKKSGFYGVNLVARKENKNTAQTNVYTRKFLLKINWQPSYSTVFAGALLYPRYNFFARQVVRLIMKMTQGETDTSKEIIYTDWGKVKQYADYFNNN